MWASFNAFLLLYNLYHPWILIQKVTSVGLPPRNQWGPLTRWPSANTASQRGGTPLLSSLPLLVCSVTTQEYFWIKSCVKGQIFLKVQNISYIKQDCSVQCSFVQWLVQCTKNQTAFTNRCTMYIERCIRAEHFGKRDIYKGSSTKSYEWNTFQI